VTTRPALWILAFCALACGPTLLFPGGPLDGDTAAAPRDWAFTKDVSTIQLETSPADPYSVNLWAIGLGDALYVHAGANRSTWVENLEADPSVRVRIDGTIYLLSAARVESQAEFDAFANAYEAKYGTRPRNESVTEVYLYRLTSR
jgi:hypothetical protein